MDGQENRIKRIVEKYFLVADGKESFDLNGFSITNFGKIDLSQAKIIYRDRPDIVLENLEQIVAIEHFEFDSSARNEKKGV